MRGITVSSCVYCLLFAPLVWIAKVLASLLLPTRAKRAFFTVSLYMELYGIKEPDEKCLLQLLKILRVATCPSSIMLPALLARWMTGQSIKDNVARLKSCRDVDCSSNAIHDLVVHAPRWQRYGTLESMIKDAQRLAKSIASEGTCCTA